MKLYHKQINSLEALKREKLRLKLKEKAAGSEFKAPLSGITSAASSDKSNNLLGTVSKLLGSSSAMDIALSLGGPIIGKVGRKGAGKVTKIAFDVLGGYLKWKLLVAGFKIGKRIIKNKKA